ncbi:nucleotide exchange factor GrpE [Roseococcus sp. SYP-B2431]|uniref:nucleotide exchange factor GrpE n=1 Tax=Roseococcus sp. SYP-B2431 TaxID=2496640 RepID=UPI00103FEA2D|nr:nucleotide exchange factor GrpE [Roseococcus sp. SYP-B2431]TCH98636.1 nucleotide exchange factor GrpE [Roseococcus sp. SYP-B2431]
MNDQQTPNPADLAPDNADATPDASPATTPEERIAALETELAEMKDRWLRAEAETQNVRTRAKDEVEKARNYAVQKFAGDVVEAFENLHRGVTMLPPATEGEPEVIGKMREGFEGVERFLLQRMEANGVVRKPADGQAFDPELHQAMSEAPAPDGVAPGTVLQAWSSAWTLNGRLLKPAMVVVAAKAN